jgi:hypothetical protein
MFGTRTLSHLTTNQRLFCITKAGGEKHQESPPAYTVGFAKEGKNEDLVFLDDFEVNVSVI